ncbi:MAG TPA: hypothetical protein VJA47_04840 [archaeon]|nr:hypothetical protein [archaeon]
MPYIALGFEDEGVVLGKEILPALFDISQPYHGGDWNRRALRDRTQPDREVGSIYVIDRFRPRVVLTLDKDYLDRTIPEGVQDEIKDGALSTVETDKDPVGSDMELGFLQRQLNEAGTAQSGG